jgi:hypothetical protein
MFDAIDVPKSGMLDIANTWRSARDIQIDPRYNLVSAPGVQRAWLEAGGGPRPR